MMKNENDYIEKNITLSFEFSKYIYLPIYSRLIDPVIEIAA
jgi:hypothetical protein